MGSRQQMLLMRVRNCPLHTALLGKSGETNLAGGRTGKGEMTEGYGNRSSARWEKGANQTHALLLPGPGQHGSPLTAALASSHLALMPRDAATISWALY